MCIAVYILQLNISWAVQQVATYQSYEKKSSPSLQCTASYDALVTRAAVHETG